MLVRKIILIPILLAVLVANPQKRHHAEAAIIMSGNSLYDLCQNYKKNRLKGELAVGCYLYIILPV
jgi:hypothetical protein